MNFNNLLNSLYKKKTLLTCCLQKLACSPDVDKDDMKRTLEEAIKSSGLDIEIRNIIYHLIRNTPKGDIKPLSQTVRSNCILFTF